MQMHNKKKHTHITLPYFDLSSVEGWGLHNMVKFNGTTTEQLAISHKCDPAFPLVIMNDLILDLSVLPWVFDQLGTFYNL